MANDPSAVTPGDSTYSLRTPDTVPAAPIPQMPMERVLPRQTSTGLARGIQQLGSPNVFVDSGNEQIIVAKTDTSNVTTPQVLMGNQVNKGEGFYVTKPGIDVTTAKNDSDFIFNSNQNVFKIVKEGTLTVPGITVSSTAGNYTSNGTDVSSPHNLDFIPALLAYYGDGTFYVPLQYSVNFSPTSSSAVWYTITPFVDSVNVSVNFDVMVFGNTSFTLQDTPIKYYLMQQTAN